MKVHLNPYTRLKARHAVVVFDRPSLAVEAARKLSGFAFTRNEMQQDRAFYGDNWEGMERAAVEGSKAFADKAKALQKQIKGVSYATPKRVIKESPFGRPSVGAYLASDPMPCRRPVTEKVDHAPLSIVVALNTFWNVSQATMEKRGTAIAALVQTVAAHRPVNLYLSRFCDVSGENTNFLVKFPTTPIDSYRLAYLLSSQAFARGLFFALHRSAKDIFAMVGETARDVSTSSWIGPAGAHNYSQKRNCPFSDDLRAFLKTDLLYIPGAYPGIEDFEAMKADAVKWVNDTAAILTKRPVK